MQALQVSKLKKRKQNEQTNKQKKNNYRNSVEGRKMEIKEYSGMCVC